MQLLEHDYLEHALLFEAVQSILEGEAQHGPLDILASIPPNLCSLQSCSQELPPAPRHPLVLTQITSRFSERMTCSLTPFSARRVAWRTFDTLCCVCRTSAVVTQTPSRV